MGLKLIITMLNIVANDQVIYGNVILALDALQNLIDSEGAASVNMVQIDTILRDNKVDVQKIYETYVQ